MSRYGDRGNPSVNAATDSATDSRTASSADRSTNSPADRSTNSPANGGGRFSTAGRRFIRDGKSNFGRNHDSDAHAGQVNPCSRIGLTDPHR